MSLRFGVIGDPIAHSRSPQMHEAAYRTTGIDATYTRVHVTGASLEAFVDDLRTGARDYRGVNVTLPHKSAVMPLLDDVSERARRIGAVNTILVEGDRLLGDNTDAPGLVQSLADVGVEIPGSRAIVLGAGGAARAAVVGLDDAGAASVVVASRRLDAGAALVEEVRREGGATLGSVPFEAPSLREAFEGVDLVVQATSATLVHEGESDASAVEFAAGLPLGALSAGSTVVDLVYTPRKTTVLAAAEALELRCVDGLGMLVHQGALAFELWLKQPAPTAAMRDALGL